MRNACCVALLVLSAAAGTAQSVGLSVKGDSVQVNGQSRFLVGVSLFDALGTTAPSDRDLDALAAWHMSLVRVWAHWNQPIYGHDGRLTGSGRRRLLEFAKRLERRHVVLELVLLRPGQLPGQSFAWLDSAKARTTAVTEIAITLKPFRLVLFDLFNEHDHPSGGVSHAEARELRDAVKRVDPGRLVTLSSTGYHIVSDDATIGVVGARNLWSEACETSGSVGVDVVEPHLPRTSDWARTVGKRIRALQTAMKEQGCTRPILLNEERRAQDDEHPIPAAEYWTAAREAKDAGAAGWLFHTKAGFDLARRPFLESLSREERRALDGLAGSLER